MKFSAAPLQLHAFAAAPATASQARSLIERRRVDLVITNSLQVLPTEHTRVLYLGVPARNVGSTSRSLPKPFELHELVAAVRDLLAAARRLVLIVDDQADDRALILNPVNMPAR